jgi:hypothetical protein
MEIILNNNQYSAVVNILKSQSIPFGTLETYFNLYKALESPVKNDNGYILILDENDLDILTSLVENGTILIREIPFALNLMKALTPTTKEEPPEIVDNQI